MWLCTCVYGHGNQGLIKIKNSTTACFLLKVKPKKMSGFRYSWKKNYLSVLSTIVSSSSRCCLHCCTPQVKLEFGACSTKTQITSPPPLLPGFSVCGAKAFFPVHWPSSWPCSSETLPVPAPALVTVLPVWPPWESSSL